VRRTWRKGSFKGKCANNVRHFQEGFGNGASLSLYRLHIGNLKGSYTEDSERHVMESSGKGAFNL